MELLSQKRQASVHVQGKFHIADRSLYNIA